MLLNYLTNNKEKKLLVCFANICTLQISHEIVFSFFVLTFDSLHFSLYYKIFYINNYVLT